MLNYQRLWQSTKKRQNWSAISPKQLTIISPRVVRPRIMSMGSYITSFSTQYGGGSIAGGETIGLGLADGGVTFPEWKSKVVDSNPPVPIVLGY